MIVFIARKSKENSTLSFFRAVFKWQNKDKNDLESAMLFLINIKNRKICDFDFKKNIFNEMYDFGRKIYLKKFLTLFSRRPKFKRQTDQSKGKKKIAR